MGLGVGTTKQLRKHYIRYLRVDDLVHPLTAVPMPWRCDAAESHFMFSKFYSPYLCIIECDCCSQKR